MDFIQRLVHYFAVVRRKARQHRRLVTTVAAAVVFATTYALILPAVTLDADTAGETPGVNIEQPATVENDGEAVETTATDEAADATSADARDAATADATANQLIAKDADGTYEATVSYGADANIPEGATLKVTPYAEDSSEYAAARKAVVDAKKADDASFDENSLGLVAVDVSIVDANGEKVEPAEGAKVAVKLTAKDFLPEGVSADAVEVQHIKDDGTATAADSVETVADSTDATDGKVTVDGDASTATAEFDVDSFSTFTISWRSGNTAYATVTVHYVDTEGNDLTGSQNGTLSISNGQTHAFATDGQNNITSGDSTYIFKEARYSAADGQVVTSVAATSGWDSRGQTSEARILTFYNGDDQVAKLEYLPATGNRQSTGERTADVYLVYVKNSGLSITSTIKEDGLLTAYEGTAKAEAGDGYHYVWSMSDSENGTYTDIERQKFSSTTYNMSEDATQVNVALTKGADKWYKVRKVSTTTGATIEESGAYHVPYYDQVQNGGFETPVVPTSGNLSDYQKLNPSITWSNGNVQIPNGSNGVVWRTTGVHNGFDIEIVSTATDTYRNYALQNYNLVASATDHDNPGTAAEGNQFAELNCETSGALYQDILTIPGVTINYGLSHRARGTTGNRDTQSDSMYVVAMPTYLAEKYDITTQEKVQWAMDQAKDGTNGFTTDNTYTRLITSDNQSWHDYTGSFTIPEGQYLTRFFYVASATASGNLTQGNLIDALSVSQDIAPARGDNATLTIVKKISGVDNTADLSNYSLPVNVYGSNGSTVLADANGNNMSASLTGWTYDSSENVWTQRVAYTVSTETALQKAVVVAEGSNGSVPAINGYKYDSTSFAFSGTKTGESTSTDSTIGSKTTTGTLKLEEKFNYTLTFTNTYEKNTGSVSFTKKGKQADGSEATALQGATFGLYRDENCSTSLKDSSDNAITATSDRNGTVTFSDIPVGDYYMRETKAPSGYQTSATVYHVKISATASESQITGENNAPVDDIVDDLVTANVTIKKTNADGTTALSDAEFTLTIKGVSTAAKAKDGLDNGGKFTVDENGTAQITGLPVGDYTLTETKAPDGYVVLTTGVDFSVNANGTVTLANGTEESKATISGTEKDVSFTLTVKNTPGKALPETGGSGTTPFAVAGVALITTALIGFALRRKSEGRGV